MELADLGKSQTALAANLPTWSDCVDGLLHEVGIESEDEVRTDSPLRKAS
jgi:hypothetical protein